MQFFTKTSVGFSLCLLLSLAFPAGPTAAATIELRSSSTIAIHGRIEAGDEGTFRTKFREQKIAVVELSSPGGEVIPALEIGDLIATAKVTTEVEEGATCASACALIWLAGKERRVNNNSQVGFHAAYRETGDGPVESGAANALVGAYLAQLGFTYHTILYVTRAAPEDMQWLTPEDGKRVGIEFVSTDTPAPDLPDANPVTISFTDWREAMLMETVFRLYNSELPEESEEFFKQSYEIYLRSGSVLDTVRAYKYHFAKWILSKIKYADDSILVEMAARDKKVLVYALKSDLSICSKLRSIEGRSSFLLERKSLRLPDDFAERLISSLRDRPKIVLEGMRGIARDVVSATKRTLKQYPADVRSVAKRHRTAKRIDVALENPRQRDELRLACALQLNIISELQKNPSKLAKFYRYMYQNLTLQGDNFVLSIEP